MRVGPWARSRALCRKDEAVAAILWAGCKGRSRAGGAVGALEGLLQKGGPLLCWSMYVWRLDRSVYMLKRRLVYRSYVIVYVSKCTQRE